MMISTKTKGPPTKHATPRTKAAAQKFAAGAKPARDVLALDDQEIADVIEIVRDQFPSLAIECRRLNVEQAEEAIRGALIANRVGPPFSYFEPGEPTVQTIPEGLRVVAPSARAGLVDWLTIAAEFCGNDFEDVDDPGTEPDLGEVRKVVDAAVEASAEPATFRDQVIPLERIMTAPDNPRRVFDQAKLEELAASIKSVGLIEPLVVQESLNGKFLLVAGERRLRAAKLAGLVEVPARVGFLMTPEQADEIRVIENLQREDLSAIEEARGFERMLRAHGYTQEKLAQRLGVSQPHIANRLRLLKLPEKWQQRVISQEISSTHVRYVLPWVEYPAIMEAIECRFYNKKGKLKQELPGVPEFERICQNAVCAETKPLTGSEWESRLGKSVGIFVPTTAQRAELGVVTVKDYAGRDVARATNVKLWGKLRAEQLKPLLAAQPKPKASKPSKATGNPKSPRVSDARFDEDLAEWRLNWLMFILGREVDRQIAAGETRLALKSLLVSFVDGLDGVQRSDVAQVIGFTGKISYMPHQSANLVEALLTYDAPEAAILELAPSLFWVGKFDKTGQPSSALEQDAIELIARWLKLDLAELWRKELAGPLTEAFFNLHDSERLEKLGVELEVYVKPRMSKTAAVKLLMGHRNTKLKLPSAIKPVAPLKAAKQPAKSKPKSKGRA